MMIFFTMILNRKEHSNDIRSLTFRMEILSETSRRKHCFHEKRWGISLTSTKESPNALETCSTEAERGRLQQQLTERFSVYRRRLAENVAAATKEQLDISLSAQSVRNRAHEIEMFSRVARKKPYINQGERLKFAKEMLQESLDFCKTVI